MPYGYIEPETFMEHNGVVIYHAYKDGNADQRLTYWFSASCNEDSYFEFDVRELPGGSELPADHAPPFEDEVKRLICNALDAGLIELPIE